MGTPEIPNMKGAYKARGQSELSHASDAWGQRGRNVQCRHRVKVFDISMSILNQIGLLSSIRAGCSSWTIQVKFGSYKGVRQPALLLGRGRINLNASPIGPTPASRLSEDALNFLRGLIAVLPDPASPPISVLPRPGDLDFLLLCQCLPCPQERARNDRRCQRGQAASRGL